VHYADKQTLEVDVGAGEIPAPPGGTGMLHTPVTAGEAIPCRQIRT